jgi:hypothetical protein
MMGKKVEMMIERLMKEDEDNYDPGVWSRLLSGTCCAFDWARVFPRKYVRDIADAAAEVSTGTGEGNDG